MDASFTPLPPPEKSNYQPILLTLLPSFLLGAGSCFAFVATVKQYPNPNFTSMNGLFAIGFAFSLLAFLGSRVWLVVKAIRDAMKRPEGAP
jgi:hypothetical protein